MTTSSTLVVCLCLGLLAFQVYSSPVAFAPKALDKEKSCQQKVGQFIMAYCNGHCLLDNAQEVIKSACQTQTTVENLIQMCCPPTEDDE